MVDHRCHLRFKIANQPPTARLNSKASFRTHAQQMKNRYFSFPFSFVVIIYVVTYFRTHFRLKSSELLVATPI